MIFYYIRFPPILTHKMLTSTCPISFIREMRNILHHRYVFETVTIYLDLLCLPKHRKGCKKDTISLENIAFCDRKYPANRKYDNEWPILDHTCSLFR